MSLDLDQIQSTYQRDDINILASQVQRNSFNIRKFRQKSMIKDKRKSMYTKYTDTSTKHRISTEPVQDRIKSIKSQMSYTNAFNRLMNKNEPDYEKRNNLVGSLKYNNRRFTDNIKRTQQSFDNQITVDIQTIKAQNYKQMTKKHHKGPLTNKIVETWLNSILMQSTQFQVLDQSLGNAALKKFEIDENSLISRSIKSQNVPRIYQSLFVHSIGFNNSIKELVSGHVEVEKNIWKVFSILLEYCAEGKFQTMIGVIQRDKVMKIQQLRQQVAKRQQIIQKNDELNENKNIQIFKQIKSLKQQNINLTNQKQILYEDYQKTQQAFNQQVALRLKFQNKINELFGVHRQLAIKHQRLYEDYKKKVIEWNTVNQKNTLITQQNGEYKIQINDLTTEKLKLISSEKYNKQLISALKQDKIKIKDQYNISKHLYEEQRTLNKQYLRRLTQLQIQVKNLTQIIGIKDKSWKQTHSQYQLSLEQNNRLYKVISDQRLQVQQLLFDKKQFNNRILNLMAEASFQKKKRQQYQRLYHDADKKLNQRIQKFKDLQLQCKILTTTNESSNQDLQLNYENINKMHAKNSELQQQLYDLRRFKNNLGQVIQQKDKLIQKFRNENQKLQSENQQLKTDLNKTQMHLKLLKAETDENMTNLNHKIDKLKQERQLFQLGDNEKNKMMISSKNQIQRLTKLMQNTILELKNEKFQRFNLKANYEQSLNIMEKKNTQQKQMGRQISQLKQQASKVKLERDRYIFALQNEIACRQKAQSKLKQTQNQFNQYKKCKSSFIHPFINEDICENYRIKKQKLEKAELAIKQLNQQISILMQKHIIQIQSVNKSNKDYFNSYKAQKQKQIYQRQTQLQYEKQINSSMKVRLEQLETLAETYARKIEQRTTSEKQKIYAQLIEQKSKSIDQLAQKLNLQIKKNQKISSQFITQSQKHENQMIELKRKNKIQKQQREQKINQLNFQLDYIQKQSQKLIQQIKEQQQNFQAKLKQRMQLYLQSYKKSDTPLQNGIKINTNSQQPQNTMPELNNTNTNWPLAGTGSKKFSTFKKRNDIGNKIKIAYNYYQHKEQK